jgi:carbamate kinase
VTRVVAALGGNAFVRPDEPLSVEGEHRFAREALRSLEAFLAPDVELLVLHGNGPQVGHQLARAERAAAVAYALPLDVCVAQTQGEMGYVLVQALQAVLAGRGLRREVAALVTQVEVDPRATAFAHPSKPVGPVLDLAAAAALRARGGAVADDAGRGPRRVVASPDPVRVVETEVVRRLLAGGAIVVAGGGGGVPVAAADGGLRGVEAVVDKDLTAALLADAVDAGLLVLLTDVPCAYTDYRTPRQAPVGRVEAARARRLLAEGHFAPGSMGPKIEACARFASTPGREAIVCDPPGVAAALRGEAGTTVVPDR